MFPLPLILVTVTSSGWEILVQEKEEQHGSKALSRRAAAEGEPDHRARLLLGAGKRRTEAASGRAAEGLRPLQEHPGQIWGQVRAAVKNSEQQKPTKYQRDKSRTPFPAKFNTDTNTTGISICTFVFAGLRSLCQAPGVALNKLLGFGVHTGRQRGMMGVVVTGRPVERAPGSYTQRKGDGCGYSQGHTHMETHDLSRDGFRKVRKLQNSRLVQNTTQVSFYHCIALLPSGPKHEYVS